MRDEVNARDAGDHGEGLLDVILPVVYGDEGNGKKALSDGGVDAQRERPRPTERRVDDEGNGGIRPHVGHGVPVLLKTPKIQVIPLLSRHFFLQFEIIRLLVQIYKKKWFSPVTKCLPRRRGGSD